MELCIIWYNDAIQGEYKIRDLLCAEESGSRGSMTVSSGRRQYLNCVMMNK